MRVGNSWSIVLPKALRSQLGWFPSDIVQVEAIDGMLVIQNTTQRDVRPISVKRDDGDHRSRTT